MVSMRVRDRESIQEAVRRFRKLVERSGLKREMRSRQYYEKPSEIKRRARLRAERRASAPDAPSRNGRVTFRWPEEHRFRRDSPAAIAVLS